MARMKTLQFVKLTNSPALAINLPQVRRRSAARVYVFLAPGQSDYRKTAFCPRPSPVSGPIVGHFAPSNRPKDHYFSGEFFTIDEKF
jgi:hypothetical protein